jgi:UPF0042 nucleotide-binding protein
MKQTRIEFFIVTGMSGAGKTQALKCFEDLGFFCADNLPIDLIPQFANIVSNSGGKLSKVALGIDIRVTAYTSVRSSNEFRDLLIDALKDIKRTGIKYKIVFLDADNTTLIKRFSETRRKHPLGKDLITAIRQERKDLQQIRAIADKIIDTANSTLGELKSEIAEVADIKFTRELVIKIVAFGYKYGIPLDSDIFFDVRFLPNPYYVDKLRRLTGNDKLVHNYVMKTEIARKFIGMLTSLISFVLPYYIKEGKSYLTIGIGCTGGKHRSVVIANMLNEFLHKKGYLVKVHYRDVDKHNS